MKPVAWLAVAGLCLPICACSATDANRKNGEEKAPEPVVKIEDLKVGTGEAVKMGDYVVVHYTGWLTDGTKFDSSLDRQEPLPLRLGAGRVIKGWEIGILGVGAEGAEPRPMKVGGKRRLTIPPELGYGKRGSNPIPPDAVLIFEIDLLRIQ